MQDLTELWPLLLYIVLVVAPVTALLGLSYVLGLRTRVRTTGEVYESGVLPIGPAQVRFHAKYYLVTRFFLIFDLEAMLIYVWAVCVREAGWTGCGEMAGFIGVLAVALLYPWRLGALDWAPDAVTVVQRREGRAVRRSTSRFTELDRAPQVGSDQEFAHPLRATVLLTGVQGRVNWSRMNWIRPFNFGWSCCYVEMPTLFTKRPPVLLRLWEQLLQPRWVNPSAPGPIPAAFRLCTAGQLPGHRLRITGLDHRVGLFAQAGAA